MNSENHKPSRVLKVLVWITVILTLLGQLFKVMRWPGASVLLVFGVFFFSFLYLPLFTIESWKFKQNGKAKASLIIQFIILWLFSVGFVFKIMHWPYGGAFYYINNFLLLLLVIPFAFYQLAMAAKRSLISSHTILLSLYFFALSFGSLVNSNTGKINIDAVLIQGINTEDALKSAASRNKHLYSTLETISNTGNDVLTAKATKLKAITDSSIAYIKKLQAHLLITIEKTPAAEADTLSSIQIRNTNNNEIATQILIGNIYNLNNDQYSARKLKAVINSFKDSLLNLVQEQNRGIIKEGLNLNTDNYDGDDGEPVSWEISNFNYMPFLYVFNTLTNIQYEMRNAEYQVLTDIINSENKNLNTALFSQIAYLNSKYGAAKKQEEIKKLQNENEKGMALLQNKDSELSDTRQTIGYFVLVIFIFLVLIFFVIRSNYLRKQANKTLSEQKQIIETQKVEIESSFSNLELLNNISSEITSSLNVERVMSQIYKNVSALMDVSFFIIATYNETDESVEVKYCVKEGKVVREEFKTSILNPDSYTAWTIKNKSEVIIMDEVNERKKYLNSPRQLHGKEDIITDTLIFIPLLIKEQVIGLFSVQSIKANAYTKANLDLLRSLSSVIAVALNNADSYNKLDSANVEITNQKAIVEEKQKEIVDSINYARRIQYTLLASDELLKSNLPEHFILFKPKDIVSGDFYWAIKKDNRFYLAVCDSTGHGVPGAFMSVLNSSFLNEAINEKNITEPHLILNYVRERLITSVSADGGQDGMDCTLICIENNIRSIKYASANNKPIHISNGELIELAANKMPVGKGTQMDSFTSYTVELNKGDTIYFFTDGFADQFGGETGQKKLTRKKFKELLLTIKDKSMQEQGILLDSFITDYRKGIEQIDDILVMGVRV